MLWGNSQPGQAELGLQGLPSHPLTRLLPVPRRTTRLHLAWAIEPATSGIAPAEGQGEASREISRWKDPAPGPGDVGGGNVPGGDTGWQAGQVPARARGPEGWGWWLNRQLVLF